MDGLEKVDIPVLLPGCGSRTSRRRYAQIETLGAATGTRRGREVAETKRTQIDELVRLAPDTASGATVYHELGPDFFSATSATFIGRSTNCSASRTSPTRPKKADAGGIRSCRRVHRPGDPDLVVLADTKCCGQTAKKVAKRPGWQGVAAVTSDDIVEAE